MSSRSFLLAGTLALVLLPSQLPAAALPLIRTDWSASAAEAGWIVAAYQLGYALAVIAVLPLTDRVRSSRVIAAGALATSLANVAFAFGATDVISGSLLRILSGFGLAGVYMPGVRLVAQSSDPARSAARSRSSRPGSCSSRSAGAAQRLPSHLSRWSRCRWPS